MSESVRDRRQAKWCWQDRAAIARIRIGLSTPPLNSVATGISVYVALTSRANSNEQCWPKMAVLAADAGVSATTARRRIFELELLGLIAVTSCIGDDGDSSNTYTLLDTPADDLAPDWLNVPPQFRPLARLAEEPRVPVSAVSPKHRHSNDGSASRQILGSRHSNNGSAGTLIMGGPASNDGRPGTPFMGVSLTELTNQSEQDKVNKDLDAEILKKYPEPAGVIDPPGLPASSVWPAIVDMLRPNLTDRVLAELRACYLSGDARHLIAVAPHFATARSLDAKTAPALRHAVSQIVSPSSRFSFYLGEGSPS